VDSEGIPAIVKAVGKELLAVTKMLLKYNVDVDAVNRKGRCATMVAASMASASTIAEEILELTAPLAKYIDKQDTDGNTAFMLASMAGSRVCIQELLKVKASVTVYNDDNNHALHLALKAMTAGAGEEVACLLIPLSVSPCAVLSVCLFVLKATGTTHNCLHPYRIQVHRKARI